MPRYFVDASWSAPEPGAGPGRAGSPHNFEPMESPGPAFRNHAVLNSSGRYGEGSPTRTYVRKGRAVDAEVLFRQVCRGRHSGVLLDGGELHWKLPKDAGFGDVVAPE